MNVIQTTDLTKTYKSVHAVLDLSLEIEEQKITGLIGRNGAGKTTLLKLIAGYFKPTSGEVRVFGRNPFNDLVVSANMVFIDDQMAFPDSLTLNDILAAASSFYSDWDHQLAQAMMDYFMLNPGQHHGGLSKGSRSLFNAILGIAAHAPLTIFDEPTTGMDSAVRKDFYRALLKDYLNHPRTVILSSHLLGEVEEILEDVLLLKEGQKVLHLPVTELKEWAIGLRGTNEQLSDIIQGQEIIYQEQFAGDHRFVVLKEETVRQKLVYAKQKGVEVIPIKTDDLCVYLTAKTKGGIDDVFKRS